MHTRYLRKMMPGQFLVPNAFLPDGDAGPAGGQGGGGTPPPANDGTPPADSDHPAGDPPKPSPNGYPVDTPWRDMQPAEQAAYWRHRAQEHEKGKKAALSDIATLKAKADQFDALDEASKSESQREIDRLKAENENLTKAQQEARRTFGTQLVETRLSAAADRKGMTADALKVVAGDLTRFLGDDGPNAEAIDEFLAAFPDKAAGSGRVDLGAGKRTPAPATSGADLWAQRHPSRKTTT